MSAKARTGFDVYDAWDLAVPVVGREREPAWGLVGLAALPIQAGGAGEVGADGQQAETMGMRERQAMRPCARVPCRAESEVRTRTLFCARRDVPVRSLSGTFHITRVGVTVTVQTIVNGDLVSAQSEMNEPFSEQPLTLFLSLDDASLAYNDTTTQASAITFTQVQVTGSAQVKSDDFSCP